MTSMIDGVKLERLAKHYNGIKEASALRLPARLPCPCCTGKSPTFGPCLDCLRLVADTLRDAAARADK